MTVCRWTVMHFVSCLEQISLIYTGTKTRTHCELTDVFPSPYLAPTNPLFVSPPTLLTMVQHYICAKVYASHN